MTIEQATVKVLSQLNLRDELAIDCVNLAILSVIGFKAVRRIVKSNDSPDYKEENLLDLLDEIDHMNINELVSDFLKDI